MSVFILATGRQIKTSNELATQKIMTLSGKTSSIAWYGVRPTQQLRWRSANHVDESVLHRNLETGRLQAILAPGSATKFVTDWCASLIVSTDSA